LRVSTNIFALWINVSENSDGTTSGALGVNILTTVPLLESHNHPAFALGNNFYYVIYFGCRENGLRKNRPTDESKSTPKDREIGGV
jgi:hypothetical protein